MKCLQAKANVYNARLLGARRREVEQSAEAESDVTRQQKKVKNFACQETNDAYNSHPTVGGAALAGSLTDRSSNACGHLRDSRRQQDYQMQVTRQFMRMMLRSRVFEQNLSGVSGIGTMQDLN